MRGDGLTSGKFFATLSGSPPHAWGRHTRERRADLTQRFTPTCVGTADHAHTSGTRMAVHPHMRGDGTTRAVATHYAAGSPPHAWGRLAAPLAWQPPQRFTPTCVGTAPPPAPPTLFPPVHPHMRGDGEGGALCAAIDRGSPPHAWGRRCSFSAFQSPGRFTPTCVGTALAPIPF